MSNYGSYDDQPLLAELYDLVPVYASRTDIGFYVDRCRKTRGQVLELGCGTGRILIPAAESGCRITGLDVSPNMLAQCRTKLDRISPEVRDRVRLTESSMADFELGASFDLVTIPFRAFQHVLSISDQMACLKRVNRHLNAHGRLILDVFQVNFKYIADPASLEERDDFPECKLPDGRKIRRASRLTAFHRAEQVNDVELIYYVTNPDGSTERVAQSFPMRYYFRYEVEHLLARCGFEIVDLLGNFDKSPLNDGSPEMIFVAEKAQNID